MLKHGTLKTWNFSKFPYLNGFNTKTYNNGDQFYLWKKHKNCSLFNRLTSLLRRIWKVCESILCPEFCDIVNFPVSYYKVVDTNCCAYQVQVFLNYNRRKRWVSNPGKQNVLDYHSNAWTTVHSFVNWIEPIKFCSKDAPLQLENIFLLKTKNVSNQAIVRTKLNLTCMCYGQKVMTNWAP